MVLRKRWNSQTPTKEAILVTKRTRPKFWLKSQFVGSEKKKGGVSAGVLLQMKIAVGSQIDLAQGLA